MTTYTLVVTGAADGHQHTSLADFPDDRTLIADARDVLTPEHTSIAVGRGAGPGVEWLGAWDWCEGAPRWTPED